MDRKKLVKELEDIKWELGGEDGDVAEAMENIVEILTDYQVDTKDESWQSIVKDYYEVSQVKQSIIDLLSSSINCSADLLQKAVSSLSTCKFKALWYKKVNKKFYDVTEKDVNELIDQLCKKYQSKSRINKLKKEAIQKINSVDIDNTQDLVATYSKLFNICINYDADTNDEKPYEFCTHWFVTLEGLKRNLKEELDKADSLHDFYEIQRKLKECEFDEGIYQIFEDGSYKDISKEGLNWLKEQLLQMLGEKK